MTNEKDKKHSDPAEDLEKKTKQSYKKPKLSEYGDLGSITKGAGSMGFEVIGFMSTGMP